MANTIIAKFQAEGLGQFTSEVNNASTQMEMFDKAQKIVNQTTGNLTKKQLELKEQISSTGGILQKLNETGKTSGTLYTDLQSKLKKLVAEYQNENKELEKKSVELKKVTLDSNNYAKVLEQVAKGEISAREAMMLLKNEMINVKLAGKENTVQFQQLRNTAGELKDVISDTSQEMSNAGSDTRGLDKAIRVTNTVVAGFSLAQGAAGLFGGENENLQKTLLKVNSAMLVLNGLQQIQEEITKKDSLFTTAATKAKELYTAAMYGASRATQILYGVMTGGLLIVLGLALTYWKEIAEAIGINIDNSEKLAEVQERLKKIEEDKKALNDAELRYLKAKGESQDVILKKELVLAELEQKKLLQEIEFAKAITKLGLNKNDPAYFYKAKKAKEKEIELEKQYQAQLLNSKSKILEIKKALDDFNTKKATEENSKVVLNELEKLKAELQKKQKELETEVSKLVVKKGKTESKLSIDLRAKITGIEEQIRVIENLIKNEPLKIEADIIFTQIESQLQEAITSLENKIKEIFAEDVFLGNNPKENEQIKLLITQLDEAKAKFEQFKADYDALFKEDEGVQLPNLFENIDAESFVNSISDITSIGKDGYKKYYDYIQSLREQGLINEQTASDAIQALQQQRLATIEANAQKAQTIYGEIFNVVSQGTQLAGQIIAQNAQKEIAVLDEKKNKGLISEKQYNKEVAKVKNEEAQKQRKVDIAMAAAKVPMVALEAFLGSINYGLIPAGIITGLATAFATAQVALIAKAPLPKFRHGGLVVGNKHEQGGVHAELEGNEFVLKREAVSKYGTKALDKINNGLLNPNVFNMPLLPVNMIYGNHTRNLDRSSEQIKNLQYKLSEKLEYIYQGIENGNQDRYMLAKKSNKILKQLKNSNKYG